MQHRTWIRACAMLDELLRRMSNHQPASLETD
ncbi:CoA pyrophosphatase, partial [Pseudomonas qingdaonensis]